MKTTIAVLVLGCFSSVSLLADSVASAQTVYQTIPSITSETWTQPIRNIGQTSHMASLKAAARPSNIFIQIQASMDALWWYDIGTLGTIDRMSYANGSFPYIRVHVFSTGGSWTAVSAYYSGSMYPLDVNYFLKREPLVALPFTGNAASITLTSPTKEYSIVGLTVTNTGAADTVMAVVCAPLDEYAGPGVITTNTSFSATLKAGQNITIRPDKVNPLTTCKAGTTTGFAITNSTGATNVVTGTIWIYPLDNETASPNTQPST